MSDHSKGVQKFIQKAIKHPGTETNAAKKAGMSTHSYMEAHKGDSGKEGQRARLGLTLEGIGKKSADSRTNTASKDADGDADDQKPLPMPKGPVKSNPSVTVSKPVKQNNPTNIPTSSNVEDKGPVVKPGQPALPTGVAEGSGSKSIASEPLQSKPGSANQHNPGDGIHIHVHMGKQK